MLAVQFDCGLSHTVALARCQDGEQNRKPLKRFPVLD